MRHSNIIVMKDIILLEKVREVKKLLEGITDINVLVDMARVTNSADLALKYILAMNNIDLNTVKKLRLTEVNQY